MNIKEILYEIENGRSPKIPRHTKSMINAILADKINIGDRVRVIATGEIGYVTKKIIYNREFQPIHSPYGYTTIQIDIGGRLKSYAARSLQRLDVLEEAVSQE